jgi:hypothetical protein
VEEFQFQLGQKKSIAALSIIGLPGGHATGYRKKLCQQVALLRRVLLGRRRAIMLIAGEVPFDKHTVQLQHTGQNSNAKGELKWPEKTEPQITKLGAISRSHQGRHCGAVRCCQ